MTDRNDEPRDPQENRSDDENEAELGEIVEALPEEIKDELARRVVEMRMEAYSYRSPVVPPQVLQGYEEIVPGSARQIMDDAHSQTTHRQGLENRHLNATVANSRRGQWFAFIIAMTVVVGGILLIATGAGAWGLAVLLPGLAILAGTFIFSEVRKGQELEARREAFPQMSETPADRQGEVEGGSRASSGQ